MYTYVCVCICICTYVCIRCVVYRGMYIRSSRGVDSGTLYYLLTYPTDQGGVSGAPATKETSKESWIDPAKGVALRGGRSKVGLVRQRERN